MWPKFDGATITCALYLFFIPTVCHILLEVLLAHLLYMKLAYVTEVWWSRYYLCLAYIFYSDCLLFYTHLKLWQVSSYIQYFPCREKVLTCWGFGSVFQVQSVDLDRWRFSSIVTLTRYFHSIHLIPYGVILLILWIFINSLCIADKDESAYL
jgi:hypothetical protein